MSAQLSTSALPFHRFVFIEDPGHGCLQVARHLVTELGLAHKITRYSYQNGGMVYLEEDLDMMTFWEAYKARYGVPPVFDRHYVPDWVGRRRYEPFTPGPEALHV